MDNQNSNTCELWRIIGVFDVEKEIDDSDPEHVGQKITITEQRMKLVRESSIKEDKWNIVYSNDWTTSTLKNYLNSDYYNGLKKSAKGMIDEANYYLGSCDYVQVTLEQLYEMERGDYVCGSCNEDVSKLKWLGKVGLMYPSDEYMVYAKGVNFSCSHPNGCTVESNAGAPVYRAHVNNSFLIRPVVYLSATVQIIDGNGSEQNPYKLK